MAILARSLGRTGAIVSSILFLVCALALVGVASAHKRVTVKVDGAERSITTYAGTVAQALEGAGVRVGEHDVIRPARTAWLRSGQTITIATARQLPVQTAQGAKWTWSAENSAIRVLSKQPEGAALPLAHAGGAALPLAAATTTVKVRYDGLEKKVPASAGLTVAQVLTAAGVSADPLDRLTLRLEGDQAVVVIERVDRLVASTDQVTQRPVQRVADPTLERGQTKVKQAGSDRVVRTTTFTQTVNGQVTHSAVAGTQELSALAPKILLIGTKAPQPSQAAPARVQAGPEAPAPAPAPAQAAPSGGVWAALAKCESGGNPRAVSSNGRYHGLYQFTVSTWRSVGGQGLPSQASPAEQTKRAQILQQRSGWGQWPACSRKIGVR